MSPKDILRTLPDTVLEMMKNGNLTLAGGYIRDYFLNVPPKDVDLFGNINNIVDLVSKLYNPKADLLRNPITISDDKLVHNVFLKEFPLTIQLCAARQENGMDSTPEQIISKFDFTINQVAITINSEDFIVGNTFFQDLITRKLIWNENAESRSGMGWSIKRMLKFVGRGFSIENESLASMISKMTCTDADALLSLFRQHEYGD